MKVFVSGSMSIRSLSNEVINRIENIKSKELQVLVGDCWGVDTLAQKYLEGYPHVIVYHIGQKPRNNIGKWDTVSVCGPQWSKDKKMSEDCDYFFAIWDGKSKGTKNNILRTKQLGKPGLIWTREKGFE